MGHLPDFLGSLALVLGVAAITTILFQRLRQPVVLGYLVAGLLVGPHVALIPVADIETVRALAELGVILLMFSLGLDFNLHKLARLAPTAGLVAAVEVGLMLTLGYLAGQLLGWSTLESVIAGGIVAISSTMIIARSLAEQGVEGRFTDLVFGVLIVEDLVAILLLAALPTLVSGTGLSAGGMLAMLGRLGLFLALALGGGLLIIPRLFRTVVRLRRPETTVVASVGFCFAAALLAMRAGYSVALGAFLAGSLIAESGASRQVAALIRPVRDMFTAVFFVAVGMLLDPRLVLEHWFAILVLLAVVLVGKVLGVSVGAFLSGAGTRTAVRSGMSMAQIGEFSFIIAGAGLAEAPTNNFLYPVAVAVSVVTAFTTPWMIRWSEPAALLVDRRLPHALQTYATLYGSWVETLRSGRKSPAPASRPRRLIRVIIVDLLGLAAVIIGTSILLPQLVQDLGRSGLSSTIAWWTVVAAGAALAFPFCYGMVRAARQLVLTTVERAFPAVAHGAVDLGRAPRRALLITLEIAAVLGIGAPLVAVTLPFVPSYSGPTFLVVVLTLVGIAFWRSARDLQGHVRATSDLVVEALARQGSAGGPNLLERVQEMIPGIGTLVPVSLTLDSPAVGQSLAELNLRGRTGATVVAVARGDARIVFPEATTRLFAGDLLALTGSQDAIRAARMILEESNPDPRLGPTVEFQVPRPMPGAGAGPPPR